MWGVVKGFQTACNLAGPLGDLTGRGDQSSRKVVHRDLAGPLGDLTGRGDVTFDQNGQNAVSAEFGILAASLPNWRFRTDKDVI